MQVLKTIALAMGVLAVSMTFAIADGGTTTATPINEDALKALQEGNERFCSGHATHEHLDGARRHETTEHGQHPAATIVACSDSRVPVELVFDQGIGDLFVIRVAGNVCGIDETGSIEYAVAHLEVPLLVVMGHRHCGAVAAAVAGSHEPGSIPAVIRHIQPALEKAKAEHPDAGGEELAAHAEVTNVWHSIEELLERSPVVRDKAHSGALRIVGAIYDTESGRVEWLGAHPTEHDLFHLADPKGVPARSQEHDSHGHQPRHG